VHLLDDGFQHRQLARDVDIVLMDRRDMEDRLLPAGNLRESVLALRRAHVLALPAEQPELERFFREYAPVDLPRWTGPVWRVRRYMKIPPIDNPLGGPVAAFCGIARPDQFFQGLESAGVRLASRTSFGDHHNYTATDLARLASKARDAGATALLTTEKDRIRLGSLASTLPALLPLQTVQLRIEIEDEDAAVDWLIHRLGLHSARDS
jgi:tetraacyldisaccharide 4'-kinase